MANPACGKVLAGVELTDAGMQQAVLLLAAGKCNAAEFKAWSDEYIAVEKTAASVAARSNGNKPTPKCAASGAISVYGLNRMPVTLYAEQWAKVFGMKDEITKFIAENRAKLLFADSDEATKAKFAAAKAKAKAEYEASQK